MRFSCLYRKAALAPLSDSIRLIAGPGSGKTRVIIARIVHAIRSGHVAPWQTVALTFTNKGANEMKERLIAELGEKRGNMVWVSTFHSFFIRQVIRRHQSVIPFCVRTGRLLTIMDPEDEVSRRRMDCK